MISLGIDRLLNEATLRAPLSGKRVALLGHPASVTKSGVLSLDALMQQPDIDIVAAFGPQHGFRGDKQDNMVESETFIDSRYNIPIFSLYGDVRRPTDEMLDTFDVLLVDLQDIGTRIYTYVATLVYMLEACAKKKKSLWVLDRPNPVGRPIEGGMLESGWESFVGEAPLLMRHGLTLGEVATWYIAKKKLTLDFKVIEMVGYSPDAAPGYGWPVGELSWVNPSPNASSLNMARCFVGTVLFEGTELSEGRGTSIPLEVIGAPDIDAEKILVKMSELKAEWLSGCLIRPCYFEPTFHKHVGKLCSGLQLHTDATLYSHHTFKPYRIAALFLKSLRLLYPNYQIWRKFHYEYEKDRLAIDLLHGSDALRNWVDDSNATVGDLEKMLSAAETVWSVERQPYLIY